MPSRAPDILRRCPLFAHLEPAQFDRLAAIAARRRLEAGEVAFRQDQPCPGLYVVGEGLVRLYKLAPSGKEHVLHLIEPGRTFAEVAVIGGFPAPATAEALEPTVCAMLPAEPLRRALDEDHALCKQLLVGLSLWVRHVVDLLEDVVLRDATGRLARYLLDAADPATGRIDLPASKRHLASHLNLTSETLSRSLRRLTEAGLIEQHNHRRLRLADPEGLADAAE
jgi:CRP/FNR family transcriptional regulator